MILFQTHLNLKMFIYLIIMFRFKIREDFGAMLLSDYIDNGYIKDTNI